MPNKKMFLLKSETKILNSRISVRMLIHQHTLLFEPNADRKTTRIGMIDPSCKVNTTQWCASIQITFTVPVLFLLAYVILSTIYQESQKFYNKLTQSLSRREKKHLLSVLQGCIYFVKYFPPPPPGIPWRNGENIGRCHFGWKGERNEEIESKSVDMHNG